MSVRRVGRRPADVRERIPPRSAAAEDRFVERCLAAFEAACTNEPPELRHLSIAGRAAAITFRSPVLGERYRAATADVQLQSGAIVAEAPALEILCWDTESTGVGLPPMPWPVEDLLPRDRIRGHTTGDVRATYQHSDGILQLYDRRRSVGFFHATSATAVPSWTDRGPFRTFITWWATDHSMAMLHASCVATDGGAAIVAGRSGAGKSTTAVTCALAGFRFLGDDVCIVELDADGGPVVHALYGRAKLEVDSAARLGLEPAPRGAPLIVDTPNSSPRAPARVLLVPEIVESHATTFEPMARTEVLRTLVPASIRESGGLGGRALQEMTRVVKELPCFRLLLGNDPSGVAEAVAAAIEAA
jgi:hypothetical protein